MNLYLDLDDMMGIIFESWDIFGLFGDNNLDICLELGLAICYNYDPKFKIWIMNGSKIWLNLLFNSNSDPIFLVNFFLHLMLHKCYSKFKILY